MATYDYPSGTSTTDSTWYDWNDSGTTSSSSCENDGVWYVWTGSGETNTTYITYEAWTGWVDEEEKTAEQERAADAQREIDRVWNEAKAENLRREKEEAENKAKQLLLDLIGEEQLKVYEETGRLFVKGKKFDYVVQKSGFVEKIDKDKVVDLCIHLRDKYAMPDTDNVIALKMAIEAEEDNVLRMANNHGSRVRPVRKAACM